MTEFEKADLNNNGVIEKAEWNKLALEDRRLEMPGCSYIRLLFC